MYYPRETLARPQNACLGGWVAVLRSGVESNVPEHAVQCVHVLVGDSVSMCVPHAVKTSGFRASALHICQC